MRKISFFSTDKNGSAPEENFTQILTFTLKLTQTLTPTGGRAIFFGGNCPDTGKNKRNEKPKRNKKQ